MTQETGVWHRSTGTYREGISSLSGGLLALWTASKIREFLAAKGFRESALRWGQREIADQKGETTRSVIAIAMTPLWGKAIKGEQRTQTRLAPTPYVAVALCFPFCLSEGHEQKEREQRRGENAFINITESKCSVAHTMSLQFLRRSVYRNI